MKLKDINPETVEGWDNWFRRHSKEFKASCQHYKNINDRNWLTYVEVGCWAGASAEWVCQNLLSHPFCRGYGIDPYPRDKRKHDLEAVQERAVSRLSFMREKWTWIKKPSVDGLIDLSREFKNLDRKIDLLYLDGQHHANDVVVDLALAWPMLRVGSVVIFDDYKRCRENPFPNVDTAVKSIQESWAGLLEPIGTWDWQAAFEVKSKSANDLMAKPKN